MRDIPTEKEIARWLNEGKIVIIERKEGGVEVVVSKK